MSQVKIALDAELNTQITALTELDDNIFIYPATTALSMSGVLTNVQAVALAVALKDSIDLVNESDMSEFWEVLNDAYTSSECSCYGFELAIDPINDMESVLAKANLIKNGKPSKNLLKLITEYKEKSYAVVKGEIDNNRQYSQHKRNTSALYMNAKQALESTYHVIDTDMLAILDEAFTLGNTKWEREQLAARYEASRYVYEGCQYHIKNNKNAPCSGEWSDDWRGRLNYRNAHGANGQSSDEARSLMELWGVPMTYNVHKAKIALEQELYDMIGGNCSDYINLKNCLIYLETYGAPQLIVDAWLEKKMSAGCGSIKIKKPCSFVQMATVYNKLCKHIDNPQTEPKPYIGVALGLDAKGSGVQISALLIDELRLLAATGFTEKMVDDVYHLVNLQFEKRGLPLLARDHVKKCFLAVLYGQGWRTFANPNSYKGRNVGAFEKNKKAGQKMDAEIFEYICDMVEGDAYTLEDWKDADGNPVYDDQGNIKQYRKYDQALLNDAAKAFHACVLATFGKVAKLMKDVRNAHVRWNENTGEYDYLTNRWQGVSYYLPDGYKVKYTQKIKYNIYQDNKTGEIVDIDLANHLSNIAESEEKRIEELKSFELNGIEFHMMDFPTKEIDRNYASRTGYVNFIQSIDALLARLICSNVTELGATHVIGIHDCFRVNICDFIDGKLHEAISTAYGQIFGDTPCKWFDGKQLVEGLNNRDITGLYFAGVQDAYEDKSLAFLNNGKRKKQKHNMFTMSGNRLRKNVNGKPMSFWVQNMENKIDNTGSAYYFCK